MQSSSKMTCTDLLIVSNNTDSESNKFQEGFVFYCMLSNCQRDVTAVRVKLIALDLADIFRCTVISKKGLSYRIVVGQMGTH